MRKSAWALTPSCGGFPGEDLFEGANGLRRAPCPKLDQPGKQLRVNRDVLIGSELQICSDLGQSPCEVIIEVVCLGHGERGTPFVFVRERARRPCLEVEDGTSLSPSPGRSLARH